MTEVVYDKLSMQEINFIANGCGPYGIGWIVPELGFNCPCKRHDVSYWVGGTQEDRKKYDDEFLEGMYKIAEGFSWWKRWMLRASAQTYYNKVRLFGRWWGFHHGKKRTYEDLREAMRVGK